MKAKSITTLGIICMAISAFASSDMQKGKEQEKGQKTGMAFEDIRMACQNPAKFHNQIAPSNIQVACRDIQYRWLPDADGAFSMETARQVMATVYSNKLSVKPVSGLVQIEPQVEPCARFKEVTELVETVRAVTCEEIIEFNGNAIDFCATAVNSLRVANQQAITTKPTGRIVDFCSNGQQSQRQK